MWFALGFAASLIVQPVGDAPNVQADQVFKAKSGTFVSLDVPWDGSDFEMSAVAEAPEPEPEPEVVVAEDGSTVAAGRMAMPTGGSAAGLLAAISAMDHSAIQSTPNGSMSPNLLCAIPWSPGFSVYCPALEPLSQLNSSFQAAFGKNLSFASAYRGGFQGRSFHGWGLAIDLTGPGGLLGFGDAEYQWLLANAPSYGWYHPFWAASNGSNPEAWHWEFGSYYRGDASDFNSAAVPNRPLIIRH